MRLRNGRSYMRASIVNRPAPSIALRCIYYSADSAAESSHTLCSSVQLLSFADLPVCRT